MFEYLFPVLRMNFNLRALFLHIFNKYFMFLVRLQIRNKESLRRIKRHNEILFCYISKPNLAYDYIVTNPYDSKPFDCTTTVGAW